MPYTLYASTLKLYLIDHCVGQAHGVTGVERQAARFSNKKAARQWLLRTRLRRGTQKLFEVKDFNPAPRKQEGKGDVADKHRGCKAA